MKSFLLKSFCFLSACLLLSIGTVQAFNLSPTAFSELSATNIGWYDGTSWIPFEVASVDEEKSNIEHSTTMAAIQSNGTGGGLWNQTSTWVGGIVPTAADVVTIDSSDVVTISGITAEFSTLQIAENATLNLHLSTQTGSSITNHGTIGIFLNGANGNMFFNCDVTNNGTINWSGFNLMSTTGSTWTNNGDINVAIHQTMTNIAISNENGGTFNKSSGNTITTNIPNFTNKAGGTITVSEGLSLTFQGAFSNAGTIDAVGTLNFNNINGTFTGGTVAGSGFLNFQGTDTITATSGVTFAVDTMEQVNGSAIIGTAGSSMSIAAGSTWRILTGTRLSMETVTNNGTLDLYITAPNGDKRFDGDLINHGTIDWHNGHLTTTDGATWTNHGTMNLRVHSSITGIEFINENGGNFNRLVGGSTLTATIPTSFTNKAGGTLTVAEGATLTFNGTFSNAGTVDAAGTLNLTNVNCTFTGGTVAGSGFLNFTGTDTITASSGVTFAVDTMEQVNGSAIIGTAGSTMSIAAGSTWRILTSTRLSMETVTNHGTLDLYITAPNGDKRFDGDLINHGTIDWHNGHLTTTDGATWTNHGTMNFRVHSSFTGIEIINENGGNINRLVGGSTLPATIPTSITNKAGGTLTVAEGATLTLNGNLSNAGTIDAAGTLNLTNVNCTFTGGTVGGTGLLNFTGIDTITATSGVTISVDTIGHSGTIIGTAGSSMTIAAASTWRMITGARLAISSVNNGKLDLYITSPNGDKFLEEDITNNGIIDWTNGHLVGRSDTTTIFNAGTFNVNTAASITDICVNNTGVINENGNSLPCVTTNFDATTAYITTWETTTANEAITIQADSVNFAYSYAVDWGDGTITTGHTGPATHTFDTAGTQTIKINGTYPRFSIAGPNFTQFKTVEQWGTIAWENMTNSYRSSQFVTINAADAPNLDSCLSMNGIFSLCTNFNSNISHWDVSTVPDVRNIFAGCTSYNQPLTNWNLSSATDISGLFRGATIFNQPVSQLNTWPAGSGPKMSVVFLSAAAFNQDISNWNVSGITDMSGMFQEASSFNQDLSGWDVSSVFFMNNMFHDATAFNQDLGNWTISNAGNMLNMLDSCGLSEMNYDSTLIKWSVQPTLKPNVVVGAAGLAYCAGAAARQSLITNNNWTFNGDVGCSSCDLVISTQPMNQTVCDGEDVTFSVAANSSVGGLSYDWQKSCVTMGTSWKVHDPGTTDPSGFPAERTYNTHVVDGVIYAATQGGVAILDEANNATTWTVYDMSTSNPSGLPSNTVNDVHFYNGVIYAATFGGGLATLDIGNGATSWTVYNSSTSGFPNSSDVRGVYVADGILYAATTNGIATLDIGNGATNWTVYTTTNGPTGMPSNFAYAVYVHNGVIYAGTSAGLATLDVGNGATNWTVYNTSTGSPSGFPNNDVRRVYYESGVIYAATWGGGFATLDVGNNATNWIVHSTTSGNGFPNDLTRGIAINGGILYVSTVGGLATLDIVNNATNWNTYTTSTIEPSGFPYNILGGVYVNNSTIYVAHWISGMSVLEKGGAFTSISNNSAGNNYIFTPTAGDTSCTYQVVVTDANGCSVTSDAISFTYDIEANCGDTQAPVLSCPEDTTLTLNVCNEFILTAADLGVTATDDTDPMPTITLSQTMFNTPGTSAVILVATDSTGNADTCVVNVTFEGNGGIFTVTAGADANQTVRGTPVTFSAATLLANDMASNNAALEIQELVLNDSIQGTLVDNQNGTWTFTPAANFTGNVAFSYVVKSADASLYFDGTSHFYEYIVADQITWAAAKAAAAARTLNGLQGYLATITSQAENDFITTKLQGYGWIGASDAEVEGEWKWVTGPEAGTQFWQGDASGAAVNGQYNNWVSVEPNNQNNEDYGHSGDNGTWNDWPNSIQWIDGYVVEYGGIDGCEPNLTATGTLNINVFLPAVTPLNAVTLSACETAAGSGRGDFVLTAAEDIENGDLDGNGANGSTNTVTYYASQADANNASNPLTNGDNLNPEVDEVWARVVDGFGRVRTIEVRLTLLFLAAPPALSTDSIPRGTYNAPAAVVTAAPVEEGAVVVITSPISTTLSPGFSVPAGSECSISIRPNSFVDPCTSSLQEEDPTAARNLGLSTNEPFQNGMKIYPNPFFEQTNIDYTIETASTVSITVFNSNGAVVANLLRQQEQLPGKYQVIFNAEYYPNGMYTVLLQTDDTHISKRVVLLK